LSERATKSSIKDGKNRVSRTFHLSASLSLNPKKKKKTNCLCWPPSAIFLISASQVARATGMSYWQPAYQKLLTSEKEQVSRT
jgi:hypothetical protein